MEQLRQKIELEILGLKTEETQLLKEADKNYTRLMVISAKITAFYEALNFTYNN